MYNLLKSISTTNGWTFTYAKKDFANLFDEVEVSGGTYVFLDPVKTNSNFDEYNQEISKTYTGTFMVLASSDLDEIDYDTRYQKYIRPITSGATATIKNAIQCDGNKTIKNWGETEVINVFDYNMDGLLITYTINE